MQEFSTPMMKQYMEIKKQYPDCLLFYRMGDFYELFLEDAHVGARVLNITLTGKSNGKNARIPMCGVPYHAVDSYLTKLVKAGYKVAICEQLSPPNKKGLVERDVVRVVTPGTLLNENSLEKKENNYIISLAIDGKTLAISASDISTGYFSTQEIAFEDVHQTLRDEVSKLHPSECILSEALYEDAELLKTLKLERGLNIFVFHEWDTFSESAQSFLKKHFNVKTLAGFGVEDKPLALEASAALLGYLQQTQKATVSHIKKITHLSGEDTVILDRSTMLNLELFSTIREHDTRGSLLTILDQTLTPMGGRLLKQWLCKPLRNKDTITERMDAVEILWEQPVPREEIRNILKSIIDIERIISRLSVGLGNARDLRNLQSTLKNMLELKSQANLESSLLQTICNQLTPEIQTVIELIEKYIVPEPPIDLRSGGMINNGINKELDIYREEVGTSKEWMLSLEKKERERTGISSLKIRFNKVFGFYIEISKANLDNIPDNYYRKQTLVNGERFITPELKRHEEIILTAEEKINDLEYTIFQDALAQVLTYVSSVQNGAQAVAQLDCLVSFAYLAEKNNYVRPKILYSGEIRIKGGRHPVVEKLLNQDDQFVPNDVCLDNVSQQLLLITGPNMAGKSVFIRQVAIIVLLAQMGSFVPADSAHISLTDRIFVRSGASDVITSGLSTFMVEMVETAHILHHATKDSLIIMDEIGRGTSTYDGISIAWAVAEYLVTAHAQPPKTLFATHYHELQSLEDQYPRSIKNYHMAVIEDKGAPIFLHTILPGGASHSFGVAVAKLAGVPQPVIEKAYEILQTLEWRDVEKGKRYFEQKAVAHVVNENNRAVSTDSLTDRLLHKELEDLDVANMTPLEALNKLAELKDKLRLYQIKNDDILID